MPFGITGIDWSIIFDVKLYIIKPIKNHTMFDNIIKVIIFCFSVKAFDMIGPPFYAYWFIFFKLAKMSITIVNIIAIACSTNKYMVLESKIRSISVDT